jgi:hypothetical protein
MVKKVLNLFPFWFVTTSTLTPNPGEGTPPWAGGLWGEIFDAPPIRGGGGGGGKGESKRRRGDVASL